MKLYNFDFGPYPQRVTIYLAEKGLADVELVRFDAPSNRTWPPASIKALSPTGSLPIILDEDGTTVTQSLAILEYLEDTRPKPDMRGATPAERAHTRELVRVFDEALPSSDCGDATAAISAAGTKATTIAVWSRSARRGISRRCASLSA